MSSTQQAHLKLAQVYLHYSAVCDADIYSHTSHLPTYASAFPFENLATIPRTSWGYRVDDFVNIYAAFFKSNDTRALNATIINS